LFFFSIEKKIGRYPHRTPWGAGRGGGCLFFFFEKNRSRSR